MVLGAVEGGGCGLQRRGEGDPQPRDGHGGQYAAGALAVEPAWGGV